MKDEPSARVPDWVSRRRDSSPRCVVHTTVRAGKTPASPPSVRSASGVEGPAAASQLAVSARGQVGAAWDRRDAPCAIRSTSPPGNSAQSPRKGWVAVSGMHGDIPRPDGALVWADRNVDPVTTGLEYILLRLLHAYGVRVQFEAFGPSCAVCRVSPGPRPQEMHRRARHRNRPVVRSA